MDDTTDVPVAKLTVEVSIGHAQSMKDRRQVVRSMKDKLRHGFNVSVAELDDASALEPGYAGGGGDLGVDRRI
jgi:soluble cytochrome b562